MGSSFSLLFPNWVNPKSSAAPVGSLQEAQHPVEFDTSPSHLGEHKGQKVPSCFLLSTGQGTSAASCPHWSPLPIHKDEQMSWEVPPSASLLD